MRVYRRANKPGQRSTGDSGGQRKEFWKDRMQAFEDAELLRENLFHFREEMAGTLRQLLGSEHYTYANGDPIGLVDQLHDLREDHRDMAESQRKHAFELVQWIVDALDNLAAAIRGQADPRAEREEARADEQRLIDMAREKALREEEHLEAVKAYLREFQPKTPDEWIVAASTFPELWERAGQVAKEAGQEAEARCQERYQQHLAQEKAIAGQTLRDRGKSPRVEPG
jgi:hypothetical protein